MSSRGQRHGQRRPKNRNPSAGKRQISVTETGTENGKSIVRRTITTGHSTETGTTIYISGRGEQTWQRLPT